MSSMSFIPGDVPQLAMDELQKILHHRNNYDRVVLIGIRGYYLDSMGKPGRNDRKIYDDAIFLVTTNGHGEIQKVKRFNANTDPSITRTGVAVLKTGSWRYMIGIHGLSRPLSRRYKALVQAKSVTVVRDNKGDDTGNFGINIHRGGYNSTSSLGCQTIPPKQWSHFIKSVEVEMRAYGQVTIGYELMDETDRRKYLGVGE